MAKACTTMMHQNLIQPFWPDDEGLTLSISQAPLLTKVSQSVAPAFCEWGGQREAKTFCLKRHFTCVVLCTNKLSSLVVYYETHKQRPKAMWELIHPHFMLSPSLQSTHIIKSMLHRHVRSQNSWLHSSFVGL